MQFSTLHYKEVYSPLTKDICQAHGIIKLVIDEFSVDEVHYMIYHWMKAVPHSEEVNVIFDKI